MCHFAMGLTHCYKTTFFYIYHVLFSTYLTLQNIVTLKDGLEITQGH